MRSVLTEFLLLLSSSTALIILAKATVILLIGLFAVALSVRAQASWRHLMLVTTFATLLALPLVVLTIPDVAIEVPAASSSQVEVNSPVVLSSSISSDTPAVTAAQVVPEAAAGWQFPSVTAILLATWLTGALLMILSMAVDLYRVTHLRRNSLPARTLATALKRASLNSGVKAADVLVHESIKAPVTFGYFRPAIVLPLEAENWDPADLDRAMIHELEHVRRADWVTQLAARVVCSFYWFHPLVWIAWRNLSLEAERACDDAVVETAGHTDYAEQLVSLSRSLSAGSGQAVLGMAKRSDLSIRISSLLDESRRRGRVGILAAACSILLGLVVVTGFGPLRAIAQSSDDPAAKEQSADKKTDLSSVRTEDDDEEDDDLAGNRLDNALFKAAERNSIETATKIIEEGANVNAVLRGDGTPLIAAARRGNLEMVRFLLDRGAKPDLGVSGDGNPLLNAARRGHYDIVMLLLDRGADINSGVEGDGNALIMAAGSGHLNVVTLLLERGADIHKVVNGDENPIIKASETGQLEAVKLLVARGADVNSRVRIERGFDGKAEFEYRTPLSMARRGGHAKVVEY